MSELDVTISAETPKDAQAIERLHERTFGPGRFVLSAYRLREHVDHLRDLSFTARIGTLLAGCTMFGAVFVNLFVLHTGAGAAIPAALLAVVYFVGWKKRAGASEESLSLR